MSRIAIAVEGDVSYEKRYRRRVQDMQEVCEYNVKLAHSVAMTALEVGATAIFAYTETGSTPKLLASFAPCCPVYAITTNEQTCRQLALAWNTIPILVNSDSKEIHDIIKQGIENVQKEGLVKEGDLVVLAGGANVLANCEGKINRTIGGVLKI